MTFNPEDFVFQATKLPEENPIILEYDAYQKLILMRVDAGDSHYFQTAVLDETLNNNLLDNLPDRWNHRNDKLAFFYVRKDGQYGLEKQKLKYDFKTRTSKWVRYTYDNFTAEDAKELFDAIKALIWAKNEIEEAQKEDSLLEITSREAYQNQIYLWLCTDRDSLMRNSDWRVLEDTPDTFDNEKELWKKWRDAVRNCIPDIETFDDIVEFLVWYEDFKWPLNPHQYHGLDPEHTTVYLEEDNHWDRYAKVGFSNESKLRQERQLNAYVSRVKQRAEQGLEVTTEMYNVLKRYKIFDDTYLNDVQIYTEK